MTGLLLGIQLLPIKKKTKKNNDDDDVDDEGTDLELSLSGRFSSIKLEKVFRLKQQGHPTTVSSKIR